MYSSDTSICRLLHDNQISLFTYHNLKSLSLLTVGDIQAMGIETLCVIPGIGAKVIKDLEHVFATIESQDPLLEVK